MPSLARAVQAATLPALLAAGSAHGTVDRDPSATERRTTDASGRAPAFRAQQRPVVAVTDTRLLRRTTESRAAWNRSTDTYERDYVYPQSWRVQVSACRSFVGIDSDEGKPLPVRDFSWRVIPLDGQSEPISVESGTAGGCKRVVRLPTLGRWRMELTVRDSTGRAASASVTRDFRDLLVLALGDSFASGEGNPDPIPIPPGRPDPPIRTPGARVDSWTDRQCHRSRHAWPFRVAEGLESRSTTVTFLSFACSGAELRQLYVQPYGGQEPTFADHTLRPQIQVARKLLGDPTRASTRGVDVLLAAAGVNDMQFADILLDCTIPFHDCRESLVDRLNGLAPAFDGLEVAISGNLRVRHSYLAEYPNRIFTNAADDHTSCGIFKAGMRAAEAFWISQQGGLMNLQLHNAAQRNGWTPVRTRDIFRHHGYCSRLIPMFRTIFRSELQQGDHKGAAHPNHRGHGATTKVIRAAVNQGAAATPISRFVVRLMRVRVTDVGFDRDFGREAPAGKWNHNVSLVVDWWRSRCGHETETLHDVPLGRWVDLSTNACLSYPIATNGHAVSLRASNKLGSFNYADAQIPPGQSPPRHDRSYEVERILRRSTGFEARPVPDPNPGGTKLLRTEHDFGSLALEYRVEIDTTAAPSGSD